MEMSPVVIAIYVVPDEENQIDQGARGFKMHPNLFYSVLELFASYSTSSFMHEQVSVCGRVQWLVF